MKFLQIMETKTISSFSTFEFSNHDVIDVVFGDVSLSKNQVREILGTERMTSAG